MDTYNYQKLVDYTLGKKIPDLVFKNANVIFVQSGEIIKTDIAVQDGYIIGIGEYNGKKELDCKNKYISPGFIDSHLHFESTMANPHELVHYASLSGTTTFIADPHEAANVSGLKGIKYILNETSSSFADVYLMMPSCVPCMDNEDSGYILEAKEMEKLFNENRILGLGEVMDTDAVLNRKPSMMDKLSMYENKIKDGHIISIEDKDLSAYAMANINTDHESTSYYYAMQKIRNGIYVHIREGSAAKNLEAIVTEIVKNDSDISMFTFCTDDKHIEDIINDGHISYNIRKAIKLGLEPIKAYKMATFNPATCYSLRDIGYIAPGKKANLVILNDMENVEIDSVYYMGKKIHQSYNKNHEILDSEYQDLLNTVNIDWFTKDMLKGKMSDYAIALTPGQLLTKKIKLKEKNTSTENINKVVSIERHHNTGKYGLANVLNYGIKNGAIASSVAHDSHNIIVVGDNDEDIMLAIEKIKDIKGGYVLVNNGKIFDYLPLPVMGLISTLNSKDMNQKLHNMIKKSYQMGVNKGIEPFITLSFLALPVIPEIRITSNGLYDVLEGKYI